MKIISIDSCIDKCTVTIRMLWMSCCLHPYKQGKLLCLINFISSVKLQNLMAGYILLRNLFLTKNAQWKNGPPPILKKLDLFREIQNSVVPSIMKIDKIFTEMFLFFTSRSLQ